MAKNEPAGAVRSAAIASLPLEEPKYQAANSALIWWAAASFAVIVGFSRLAYGLLLPAMRADLSGAYGSYGLVGTANFAGYLIGTLLVPPLLTRYSNRIRLNIIALLAMNLAMLGSGSSLDLWQLGFWRLLIGLFSALATVLSMALVLERVHPAERGRATGLIWMGGSFGIVISGLIAPVIISTGSNLAWRLVWIAMGLAGIVHRYILASRPPLARPSPGQPAAKISLWATMTELFQPRGLLFLTLSYFTFGFGYIIYSVYFVSYLKEQGLPEILSGLIWAATGLAGVIGGFVWGRMIDRWPTGFTLALCLVFGTVGSGLILTGLLAIEFVGAALLGLALIGSPVITTVLLKRAVPAERYTSSFSFVTSIFAIGQMLGPVVGGALVDSLHNQGTLVALAAGIFLTAILLGTSALCATGYGWMQGKARS